MGNAHLDDQHRQEWKERDCAVAVAMTYGLVPAAGDSILQTSIETDETAIHLSHIKTYFLCLCPFMLFCSQTFTFVNTQLIKCIFWWRDAFMPHQKRKRSYSMVNIWAVIPRIFTKTIALLYITNMFLSASFSSGNGSFVMLPCSETFTFINTELMRSLVKRCFF